MPMISGYPVVDRDGLIEQFEPRRSIARLVLQNPQHVQHVGPAGILRKQLAIQALGLRQATGHVMFDRLIPELTRSRERHRKPHTEESKDAVLREFPRHDTQFTLVGLRGVAPASRRAKLALHATYRAVLVALKSWETPAPSPGHEAEIDRMKLDIASLDSSAASGRMNLHLSLGNALSARKDFPAPPRATAMRSRSSHHIG